MKNICIYISILLITSSGFRIKNDDKLIQSKGVEALLEAEVHKACRERGIHVAEEMQQQVFEHILKLYLSSNN